MFLKVQPMDNLSLSITDQLGLAADKAEHKQIYELCLLYVLKKLSAAAFQAQLKTITKKSCTKFRLELIQSTYIIRNLKAFIIALSRAKLNAENLAERFSIGVEDLTACRVSKKLISGFDYTKKISMRVCNLKKLDAKLEGIIRELQIYCNRFVRKKLLFVLRSCNFEVHDLAGELICKAITTFYHTSIECRTKLHTLNFLRMTCKNHGNNMINYFTAKKRSRLIQVGEGGNEFSLTIVSENQLNLLENGEEANYDSLSGGYDSSEQVILEQSVAQVFSSYSNEKKKVGFTGMVKTEFVKLLMGFYNKGFTEFLYKKGVKYSNDEYIDRVKTSRYIELVANYLEVDKLRTKTLLMSLRKKLA